MRHAVDLEELFDDLGAEGVAGAAGAEAELVALAVRVAPDEVGHGALVGDLAEAVDDLDLVDGVDAGRQAAVHAEDLVVDDDRERQEVEHVGEVVPHVGVAVLARAFGVEAVRLRHAARLVIAADEVDAVRIAQLEADEERDGFDAKKAAVDVVTCEEGFPSVRASVRAAELRHKRPGLTMSKARAGSGARTKEEIVCVRAEASNSEDFYHVKELAVDVSNDGDGRVNVHNVTLLHQELLRLGAYCLDDGVGEELLLVEASYALIEVDGRCEERVSGLNGRAAAALEGYPGGLA